MNERANECNEYNCKVAGINFSEIWWLLSSFDYLREIKSSLANGMMLKWNLIFFSSFNWLANGMWVELLRQKGLILFYVADFIKLIFICILKICKNWKKFNCEFT